MGYARVLWQDQRLEPHRDALLADDCERVFEEKFSSTEAEAQALRQAFDYCREDVVLAVARLDRLRRSLKELIDHLIVGREAETKWEELPASHSSWGSGAGRPGSPTTPSRNT